MSFCDKPREQLESVEDSYRVLIAGLKDVVVCTLDPSGNILTCSPAAEQVAGYRVEELVGESFACLYRAAEREVGKPSRDLEAARTSGRFEDKAWRLRGDGSEFWAGTVVASLTDGSGRHRGFAMMIRDMTCCRQSEEALRSVLDHVLEGIITIDHRGLIQSFNPAAERIFDYQAAEVLGRSVNMLMPESVQHEHDQHLENYLRTGEAKVIGIGREVSGRRRDGSIFPMDLAVSEFRLHGQVFFTGIVRDITERKRLEQELRRRISELAETDRRKDEFLAMLAHELRNPLAAISNAVQLVGQFSDRQQSEWAALVINRQIKHLTRLIEDLLDVSRITRGQVHLHKEIIDVASVLENAVQNVRPAIDERKHTLTVSAQAGTMWVDADATRIEQVLTNLLNNAAKYTDKGGSIWIEAAREDSEAVIKIKDTGIGIPADKLSLIFELFAQGDRSLARQEGGLGIGLTLARSLAELHGGSLDAFSAGPGEGSEFTLRLPAAERPRADGHPEQIQAATAGAGSRVLVVDDNLELALGLARLLKLLGHDVRLAHDGPTALEVAAAFQPAVVLLDIGLPGLDGYQVAMALRQEGPSKDARIIAITGYGHEDDRKRSREAGFDHHLVKPIEFRSLITLLAETAPSK